jgi:hypothetical protein
MPRAQETLRVASRRLVAWARGSLGRAILVVATAWFVLGFGAILWAEGLNPRIFCTPDEAANRQAAGVIVETGRPFLTLPFEDPEDLAHPRGWLTQGPVAVPIYPPVPIYFYAFLLRLGWVGRALLVLLPASALAAFAAGIARLLPEGRRYFALLAPTLAMPALYWLLRPWMNLCALLTCVCWAVSCFSFWCAGGRKGWLAATMACVGAAAATRPDYTVYLLLVAMLLAWGRRPAEWRRIGALGVAAGAGALVANLAGNYLVTGHPFRAAYQLAMAEDKAAPHVNPALKLVQLLFFPMTFPGFGAVGHALFRYWVSMQPTWILLGAQLCLFVFLKRARRSERIAVVATLLLACAFMISRIDLDLFGFDRDDAWVTDSLPRYWSPVYLLASIPPLLVIASAKARWQALAGGLVLLALAAGNLVNLGWRAPQSVLRQHILFHKEGEWLPRIKRLVPPDAIIYTPSWDKVLWSRFRVGSTGDDLALTSRSVERAVKSPLPVFFWALKLQASQYHDVEMALRQRGLVLVKLDDHLRLYKVEARPSEAQ